MNRDEQLNNIYTKWAAALEWKNAHAGQWKKGLR